ncbi:C40 family peptidase [Spongiactinospora sp. TRM90649]|uniref:C40 family peptidase n=1 Tax=Spongiactinospora sp. TRM90649 TaxID=3031114 RepID=UPI0023F80CF7|nr:C40 family peptidase [Spongiactinospora sp. TRM90649]MDF5758796.1 C40 family peptidase [Spongiactinospora sp. TRM90649]
MTYAVAGAALFVLLMVAIIGATAGVLGGGLESPAHCLPVTGLDGEQTRNAALIVQTAVRLRLPSRAAVIALATAMQESQLRNITHGHLDSLGLFQQRPSQGWGTPEQILEPGFAANRFYERLLRVPRWERLPLTEAAQAVQRSAFPDAYARWEPLAQRTVDALTGSCVPLIAGDRAAAVVAYAHAQLGKPYVWGAEGPGSFDCSGLTMRAYQAAGIVIPRVAADQWRHGRGIRAGREQPGDLVFFRMEADGPGHVGIVIGGSQMINAPASGDVVKVASYRRSDLVGFTRPVGGSSAIAEY